MNFQQMLTTFIGDSVEVAVPSQFIDGTLKQVGTTQLTLQSTPPVYGPPGQVVVPYVNIDYVRVLIAA